MWWKLLVLGALLELVAAYNLEGFTHLTNLTFGKSGVGCTRQGRKCIKEANCINSDCKCPDPLKGHGEIECVDKDKLLCYVAADPKVVSFKGATAFVALPCRFRAAWFITDFNKATIDKRGDCSFEVWGTNTLLHGRYVIRHVHISVMISDIGSSIAADIFKNSTVSYDFNDTEIYEHVAKVERTHNIIGSYRHENLLGVDLYPKFDEENNFAILDVPDCGTRIKYRAYDPRRAKHQKQLPGLTIMAPKDADFVLGWHDYPQSLCGSRNDGRNLYEDRAISLGLKDATTAVLYDILDQSPPQDDNTGMKGRCERTFNTFKNSTETTKRLEDTNFCGFLLTQSNVGKCIEDNLRQPIDIFTACLSYRQGDNKWCGALRYITSKCNGVKGWDTTLTVADTRCPRTASDIMEEPTED